jgi:BirA family transcriptional regulator, biotin operon repressor / biotin---[acetyl-CoA-carboxylase] ligase
MVSASHEPFALDRLTPALRPFRLHYYPKLTSTNDKAIELRRAGELFAPAVVLTAQQTAGRGRGGNRWFSTSGSITVTFIIPVEEHLLPHQLPLLAGLAVRNAATELTGSRDIGLKWPNDVLYSGRKIAGLLCERISGIDIVGIGLNVNIKPAEAPAGLRQGLSSLSTIAGCTFDLTDTLILLTQHLQRMLLSRHSHPFAAFLDEYRQHDALLGKQISVQVPGEGQLLRGTSEGIDSGGRLLVRSGQRLYPIIAGTISIDPISDAP